MGKSFMLSLSVTFVLVGLLYVFMKQKLSTSEGKLNTLFGVVQQLAGEIQLLKDRNNHAPPAKSTADPVNIKTESETGPKIIEVSDDESRRSGDDSGQDSGEDSGEESSDYDSSDDGSDKDEDEGRLTVEKVGDDSNVEKEDVATMEISVEEISPDTLIEAPSSSDAPVALETDLQPMEINLEITPLDSELADTSKIVEVDLDEDLSKLSVKELKGKVEAINGPPLKTKKALIEYLNSKK